VAHTDKGNYSAKHRTDTHLNAAVLQAVKSIAGNGTISCAAAHKIARNHSVNPSDVGRAIDNAEVQITHCQLGIFKHSADKPGEPEKLELKPELEEALRAAQVNGRLPCEAAWSVADCFGMSRKKAGAACDRLGIKINACQLGTFD